MQLIRLKDINEGKIHFVVLLSVYMGIYVYGCEHLSG